jgi:hypothetical protein
VLRPGLLRGLRPEELSSVPAGLPEGQAGLLQAVLRLLRTEVLRGPQVLCGPGLLRGPQVL